MGAGSGRKAEPNEGGPVDGRDLARLEVAVPGVTELTRPNHSASSPCRDGTASPTDPTHALDRAMRALRAARGDLDGDGGIGQALLRLDHHRQGVAG